MKSMYNNEWRKLSKSILDTQPNCALCAIRHIVKPANEIHHLIKPDKQDPELMPRLLLDMDNLLPVCSNCHKHIHQQNWYIWPEQRELLNYMKNELCKKYFDQGQIVIWTNDLHPKVRKQRKF